MTKLLKTCVTDCMLPMQPCMGSIIGMMLCVLDDDDQEVRLVTLHAPEGFYRG